MVLVKPIAAKDKFMTTTDQDPKPEKPATPSNAEAAAKRSKAFGTFLLAALLSGLLLIGAGAYLLLAPDPITRIPAAAPPVAPSTKPENTLTFIAPRSVIDPDLLSDFETESGLKVDLVSYDNEESLASIAVGSVLNADVILAAGTTIQGLERNTALSVLPARSIENLGRIDPSLRTLAKAYDPTGLSAVPYAWTSVGLGINAAALTSRLSKSQTLDTWALLFDPTLVASLSECGVSSVDAPSLAFPSALLSLGQPPFSDTPNDVERASAAWESIRAKIAHFDTRALTETLATGKACLALAPANNIYQARALARNAGQPFNIEFVMPREGSVLRLYMLAMPRAARQSERSAALIDYLLKPEVSARMTNAQWLANAVPASLLYVRQDIKNDANIYPGLDALARLTPEANPSQATISLRERFWLLMSSGGSAP
jgi:putrescine transport system substrate-binding protein